MNAFDNLFSIYQLSIDKLSDLSFESKIGLSINKNLNHFNKDDLINEILKMTEFYNEIDILDNIDAEFRVKSIDSINLKYDRYFPNHPVKRVFNDILGFRILSSSYNDYIALSCENIRIVDMSHGKAHDDGYRGVHIYYQKNSKCYPIEIQINTYIDRQFNDWLHSYIYKRNIADSVGVTLRNKYEKGLILTEESFKEELYKCVT